MIPIRTYNNLRIPTWALSYIVNADSSGITEEDKNLVDKYLGVFEKAAENLGGDVIFSIETYEMDLEEAEQVLIEDIEDILRDRDNYYHFDDRETLRKLDDVVRLRKIKDEYKESYFSWKPCFGGGSDVQECTILIVKNKEKI